VLVATAITHGLAGYRRGCHCETCRAAKRDYMRAYRARKLQELVGDEVAAATATVQGDVDPVAAPLSIDFTADPGPIETALRRDLRALEGEPPWRRTLSKIARLNARMLDQVNRHDRLDLVSPLELRTMELLNRLRAVSAGSSIPDDAAAFLSDLNTSD
jgi:hypothetical protein